MDSERETPRLLLELVGGAAGIVVYVSIVGSAVISARLHALGVPVESTLIVLPRDQVIVAGVRVLGLGLVTGLLVVLVLWALDLVKPLDAHATAKRRARIVVLLLGLVPLVIYAFSGGLTDQMVALVCVATVMAVAILAVLVLWTDGLGRGRWRLLAILAALGGVVAFARAYSPPVALDFADIQLDDGGRSNGYLLGESSDSIVLAPDVMGRTIGRSVAFQRSHVVALRISRVEKPVRPIGPQPVSRFSVSFTDPKVHAIASTLLHVRLSAQWKYPPLLYRESIRAWQRTFAEFSRGGVAGHLAAQDTTLRDLNEQTPLFAGSMVHLHARVLEATSWRSERPQTIVFRQPDTARYLGTCELWSAQDHALAPKAEVQLTGLVIASGIFVSGGGTERRRVAMVCETST